MDIIAEFSYKIYENGSYMICQYKADDLTAIGLKGKRIVVKGEGLPQDKGVKFCLTGDLIKERRMGKEVTCLKLTRWSDVKPETKDGIIAFLVKLIDGVGPKTASKMYSEFADQVFNVMKNSPDDLCRVKGIDKRKAAKIQLSYLRREAARELFEFLWPIGVKDKLIGKVYQMFGAEAVSKIKDDPFILTRVDGIAFYTADRVASTIGYPKSAVSRIEAGIDEVLRENETGGGVFFRKAIGKTFYGRPIAEHVGNGSTYLDYFTLWYYLTRLLDITVPEKDYLDALSGAVQRGRIYIDMHNGRKKSTLKIYRRGTAIAEFTGARILMQRLAMKADEVPDILNIVKECEEKAAAVLSDEQRRAIATAITSRVSIITGGPGTGKTSVQNIMLNAYKTAFPKKSIVLAAPTGKAAKRMRDVSGLPASTIHSLLGIEASNGLITRWDEIDYDLVVVDEASMMDTFIFYALMEAVPKTSQIVFIGDVNQLPSVGCGSVLNSLIDCGKIPVSRLTHIFRQSDGSSIAMNAARIKGGEVTLEYDQGFVLYEAEDTEDIVSTVKRLYREAVDTYGIDEVAVLTAYRKSTASGVNELNPVLKRIIQGEVAEFGPKKLSVGDRVMYTKNDKGLGLNNGDVGTITKISEKGNVITARFAECAVDLVEEDIDPLEMAYACTVHKSQGSEYQCGIVIVDNAHSNMLKRNLTYTGITRCSKKCILVGSKEALFKSIKDVDSSTRMTQLGELIASKNEEAGPQDEAVQLEL